MDSSTFRLMRQHGLQAPHRLGQAHGPKAHDGSILTDRPDGPGPPAVVLSGRRRAKRRRLCRRSRLLHSLSLPSTRPDRRRISPPAAPVAYSVVRLLIYTAAAGLMQQQKENVLAMPAFLVHNLGCLCGLGVFMGHSYEEIRSVCLDLLAGREKPSQLDLNQYAHLQIGVAEVFLRREGPSKGGDPPLFDRGYPQLSPADRDLFLEVFWGLFREGIITLGLDDANLKFPFFRVSGFGRRLLDGGDAYFFHDVSSYENTIKSQVPNVDPVTLVYLKEAMQAFKSGCLLSATVMLGVATEHTFLLLVETIEGNPKYAPTYASVGKERTILQKMNKFKNVLDQNAKALPPDVKEDVDTNFAGILSIIRNFRNQSGHPTGTVIDREQAYVLLQLFIPYCRKMYQLMDYFK